MREIKFRAWDDTDEKWVEGGLANIIYEYENDPAWVFLQQFTGLKDKNGVEIYEKDVVSYSDYYIGDFDIPSGKGVVEFDNGEYIVSGPEFAPKLCSEEIKNEHIEIIGNVFENPELVDK